MAARIAMHRGVRAVVVDRVPDRLARVSGRGALTIDFETADGAVPELVRDLTDGRGADAVIDAVGMEAHGSPMAEAAQKALALLPKKVQGAVMTKAGVDRLEAVYLALESVRRGGTVSISGVYGGAADPLPLMQMFDKQVQLRMGQANVRRWTDEILSLLQQDDDVLGVESFATHHLPLEEAPDAYKKFQAKQDGYVKVVFRP
jgi:threonine dehydrogenase-like Zn-dependent dehydrogenase